MDVQAPEPGQVEDAPGEDPAVRGHDERVGPRVREAPDRPVVLQRRRLENVHSQRLREGRDRRVRDFRLPPDRLAGLGDDEDDVLAGCPERLERRDRKGRRAEKNDAHACSV